LQERGAHGLFYDYRELLKEGTEQLQPEGGGDRVGGAAAVFEAEVLVLDELGAAKPSDWVWDTVAHILNSRYNDRRTTIITTNYPNAEALGAMPRRQNREEERGAGRRRAGHERRDAGRSHRRTDALAAAGDVCGGRDAWQGLPAEREAGQFRASSDLEAD